MCWCCCSRSCAAARCATRRRWRRSRSARPGSTCSTGGAANAGAHAFSQAFPTDLLPAADAAPEPLDTTRLQQCLAALPERERSVLVMTFYDERPADQVAAELGLTSGNVRVIRHRGLEHLRACMQAAEGAA